MIGNYFTMYDPVPLSGDASKNYRTDQRSVFVYDANADDFRKVSIQKALHACMRFQDTPEGLLRDDYFFDQPIEGLPGHARDPEHKGNDYGDMFTVYCGTNKVWRNARNLGELRNGNVISRAAWVAMVRSLGVQVGRGKSEADMLTLLELDGGSIYYTSSTKGGRTPSCDGPRSSQSKASSRSAAEESRVKPAAKRTSVRAATSATKGAAKKDLDASAARASAAENLDYEPLDNLLRALKPSRRVFLALAAADVRLPFAFLLLRPFQRYNCSSAILAQGGKDLGVTFHGHHDFQLTDDVIHKTHVGHYTFYSKTVIKNPNRYVIAEDVFCTKYCGGENTTFFTSEAEFEEVATGSKTSNRSLLSVIVPHDRYGIDGSDRIQNPLDITGRFEPIYTKNLTTADDAAHYPGAALLSQTLDLGRVDWGPANEDRFNAMYQHLNRVCFQGRQFAYDWKTHTFAVETLESGHWGRAGTYAGCRAAREGRGMLVQPDRESTLL